MMCVTCEPSRDRQLEIYYLGNKSKFNQIIYKQVGQVHSGYDAGDNKPRK